MIRSNILGQAMLNQGMKNEAIIDGLTKYLKIITPKMIEKLENTIKNSTDENERLEAKKLLEKL